MLDAKTLAAIKMPNRGMFVEDPRPDVRNVDCVTGCPGRKMNVGAGRSRFVPVREPTCYVPQSDVASGEGLDAVPLAGPSGA